MKNFNHLHRVLGHPSKSQLEAERKRRGHIGAKVKSLLEQIDCDRCAEINRRRTPARPRAAILECMRSGVSGRMDVGHFEHPALGAFRAAVGVDAKSGEAFGDVIWAESGLAVAKVYVSRCAQLYEEVTYDLANFARGADFSNFMARLGLTAKYVPTEAH